MRSNRLRQLLNEDKPSLAMHISSPSPDLAEIIGQTGAVDYIEVLAEYWPYDLYDFDNFARATELNGISSMIKVDIENKTFVAQRAIGSGIQNILFSDTRTVEDAKACISAVRADTPQSGGSFGAADRRFSSYGLEGGTDEYVQVLDDCVIALMIEKREAVENLEDILSLGGIDMVTFGANDYSLSLGKPRAFEKGDTEVKEAIEYTYKTALKMGVHPRVAIGSPEAAIPWMEMGVKHFAMGTDWHIIYQFAKDNCGELRKMLEK